MPLVEFPLSSGVDQHTDPRKLQPAKLLSASNAQMLKAGKLSKRYGTVPLTAPGGANPYVLARRANETLLVHRHRLQVASPGLAVETAGVQVVTYNDLDHVPGYTFRETPVSQGASADVDPDIAINATKGYRCYVWGADGSSASVAQRVWATVIDDRSGALVGGPSAVSSGVNGYAPHVVALLNSFIAVWNDGAGNIKASRLDMTGAPPYSWGAPTNLATDARTAGGADFHVFDVVVAGNTFVLVYENNAGTTANMSIRAFNESLALVTTNLGIVTNATQAFHCLSAVVSTTALYVVWGQSTGTFPVFQSAQFNSSTLITTVAPGANYAASAAEAFTGPSLAVLGNGNVFVAFGMLTNNATPAQPSTQSYVLSATTLGAIGGNQILLRARPVSDLFVVAASNGESARCFGLVTMATVSSFNSGEVMRGAVHLVEYGNAFDTSTANLLPRPVATWSPRTAPDGVYATGRNSSASPASIVTGADGLVRSVTSRSSQVIAYGAGGTIPRLTIYELAMDPDQSHRQSAELGGLTYLSGGVPSWYDGQRVGEISFLNYPYATITSSAAGGSLTASAVYQYAFIFRQYDNAGNLHRSAPMIVSKTLGAGDNRCVLVVSWLNLTTRQDPANTTQKVAVEIYRTKANDSTFRCLTVEVALASGVSASSAGTMQNDPASFSFTYTDQAADSTLDGQQLLYTTGGTLENVNPPSARLLCVHRGRLVLAGTPDGKTIWESKKTSGGDAPGFSEGLTLYIDDGADITAIQSLDDKLIAFKSDRIFFFTGDGPDDTGGNSDWSDPIRLASTVGATSPHTLVTPFGLVFRSAVGISLLGRDLQVQPYWGSPIEDTLALYPVVTGMMLHPTLPEIRITLSSTGLNSGSVELRYDYRHDAWFLADYSVYVGTAFPVRSCGVLYNAALAADAPHYACNDGTLFVEKTGSYTDDSGKTYVATQLEFAPVASGGTQGYQTLHSVIVQGDRYTDHTMTIDIAYDDNAYGAGAPASESVTIPAATSAAWPVYQFERAPSAASNCERFKVRLTDALGAGAKGTAQGFAISSIAFDVEAKKGPNQRLPAAQRV